MERGERSTVQDWTRAAIVGGATYFIIFAAAVSLFEAIGRLIAVPAFDGAPDFDIQEPIVMITCWVAAITAAGANSVPTRPAPRLLMGATGFVLLVLAEAYVSLVIENESPVQLARGFASPSGVLRLAGYVAFSLAPLLQIWIRWHAPDEQQNNNGVNHANGAHP